MQLSLGKGLEKVLSQNLLGVLDALINIIIKYALLCFGFLFLTFISVFLVAFLSYLWLFCRLQSSFGKLETKVYRCICDSLCQDGNVVESICACLVMRCRVCVLCV